MNSNLSIFATDRWPVKVTILIIILAGLGIRLFDITDPPLDFHPARQFHSAILARGFYAHLEPDMEPQEHSVAIAQGNSEMWIEPPILEGLVGLTYKLAGGEYLWIPRLYSIVIWMIGAVGLLMLARKLSGLDGAIVGLMYFLFLPYGIFASRSFQPDSLMVCLLIYSLLTLLSWSPEGDWKSTFTAGILAGLAILVKQVAVFFIIGAFLGYLLSGWGFKKAVRSPKTWVWGLLAILPAGLYNIYGVFIDGFLKGQYSMRFYPELWSDIGFYLRWMIMIDGTVGFLPFLIGMAGILLIPTLTRRGMLFGFWGGYVVYGMIFSHHISTHDYYQLMLAPVVAVGIAPMLDMVIKDILQYRPGFFSVFILFMIALAGSGYCIWQAESTLKKIDYRSQPALWQHIGKEVGYESSNVTGLFNDYGVALQYWGYTTPTVWPATADQKLRGITFSQEEIENQLAGKFYFIVTDFKDYENQPDLKAALGKYAVLEQGDGYLVYDLRRKLP